MKNFEKWIKSTKFKEVWCYECGGISKDDLAPVWKAALEYVLSMEEFNSEPPLQGAILIVEHDIKEELKDD